MWCMHNLYGGTSKAVLMASDNKQKYIEAKKIYVISLFHDFLNFRQVVRH